MKPPLSTQWARKWENMSSVSENVEVTPHPVHSRALLAAAAQHIRSSSVLSEVFSTSYHHPP